MKVIAKKPLCYGGFNWPVGSVVDVEPNTANYLVGMLAVVMAPKDAAVSETPDLGPPRQSLESVAMEKAAASIVQAVAKASKGKKDDLA